MNALENKIFLCTVTPHGEHNIIYSICSINLEMNLHEFNILLITYHQKELLIIKKDHFHRHTYYITLLLSTLLTLRLYSTDDVTSNWYYTSVISFLLHSFITLMHRVVCDKLKLQDIIREAQVSLALTIDGLLAARQQTDLTNIIIICIIFSAVLILCPVIIYAVYNLTVEIQRCSLHIADR